MGRPTSPQNCPFPFYDNHPFLDDMHPLTICTHSSTIPTHDPKWHPDPIIRFATIHFTDRQTGRQTERQMVEANVPYHERLTLRGRHANNITHTALFQGLPRSASTKKVKPIWVLLKQETVSGSDVSRAICKSAPCPRQMTTPAPHHLVFYRPDALLPPQPTASKH